MRMYRSQRVLALQEWSWQDWYGVWTGGGVVLMISGVGVGKESSEEWLESGDKVWLVVYGVCAAWSDRSVGIRVWG